MHRFKDKEEVVELEKILTDLTLVNFSMCLPVFYCLDQLLYFNLGRKSKRGGVRAGCH